MEFEMSEDYSHTQEGVDIIRDDGEEQNTQDTENQLITVEYSDSDEMLVDLVRRYEHLYDKSNQHYKDRLMKDNSWAEIAAVMDTPVAACQNRWQRLRERWSRENKKIQDGYPTGSQSENRPIWVLFHQMEFLKNHISTRKRMTNVRSQRLTATASSHRTTTSSQLEINIPNTTCFNTPLPSPAASTPPADDPGSEQTITPKTCNDRWSTASAKKQEYLDTSFRDLSKAITSHLTKNENKNDADELFCKFITAELKKKSETSKDELKNIF